jgi:GGDEF domain-containing protein
MVGDPTTDTATGYHTQRYLIKTGLPEYLAKAQASGAPFSAFLLKLGSFYQQLDEPARQQTTQRVKNILDTADFDEKARMHEDTYFLLIRVADAEKCAQKEHTLRSRMLSTLRTADFKVAAKSFVAGAQDAGAVLQSLESALQ